MMMLRWCFNSGAALHYRRWATRGYTRVRPLRKDAPHLAEHVMKRYRHTCKRPLTCIARGYLLSEVWAHSAGMCANHRSYISNGHWSGGGRR